MPRGMVGLLAAVGAAMSALVGLAHGGVVWLMIAAATVAVGLAAYGALPLKKKSCAVSLARPMATVVDYLGVGCPVSGCAGVRGAGE